MEIAFDYIVDDLRFILARKGDLAGEHYVKYNPH
jgi:hypothetical protein